MNNSKPYKEIKVNLNLVRNEKMSEKSQKQKNEAEIVAELRKAVKEAKNKRERLIFQRKLVAMLPMGFVSEYRARNGSKTQIWRPKSPKPLERVK